MTRLSPLMSVSDRVLMLEERPDPVYARDPCHSFLDEGFARSVVGSGRTRKMSCRPLAGLSRPTF